MLLTTLGQDLTAALALTRELIGQGLSLESVLMHYVSLMPSHLRNEDVVYFGNWVHAHHVAHNCPDTYETKMCLMMGFVLQCTRFGFGLRLKGDTMVLRTAAGASTEFTTEFRNILDFALCGFTGENVEIVIKEHPDNLAVLPTDMDPRPPSPPAPVPKAPVPTAKQIAERKGTGVSIAVLRATKPKEDDEAKSIRAAARAAIAKADAKKAQKRGRSA
jgi:hypothetical protein